MPPLPSTPSSIVVKDYFKRWKSLESYSLQEESLGLLFKEYCPSNSNLKHVLLKVSALNDFYSTNIFDTYSVASHICNLRIDRRLKDGELTLVNELALVTIKGKTKNFYSFATKYCNHHIPENYPIYDSYVEKMLMHFSRTDGFSTFRKEEIKQYHHFVRIIKEFQSHYGLEKFSLRQIDIYLWLAGKEFFPNKYKSDKPKVHLK